MAHLYELDGIKYPSVTTVIHVLGSRKLMKWANIMGFNRRNIDDILQDTSSFGTQVHKVLECYLTNKDYTKEVNPLLMRRFESILRQFEKAYPWGSYKNIKNELSMVDDTLGYGGTADWIMEMDGAIYLCDFKTSKNISPSMQLQLGAYAKLIEATNKIKIDKARIIRVNDLYCRSTEYSKEDLDLGYNAFSHLLQFYNLYADKLD